MKPLLRIGYYYHSTDPDTLVKALYEASDPECLPYGSREYLRGYNILYSEPYTHEYCEKYGIDLNSEYAIQPRYG